MIINSGFPIKKVKKNAFVDYEEIISQLTGIDPDENNQDG